MAAALAAAAPFLTVASGVVSAVGAIMGGQQQAAALEAQAQADRANAEQQRINAGQALNQSEAEAQRTENQARRRAAAAFTQAAGSGIDPQSGSPLDLMADIAAEGALDVQIQRWKGRNQAAAYQAQAAGFERQAGFAQQSAGEAATGGFIRAGTSILGGLAQYGTMRTRMGVP